MNCQVGGCDSEGEAVGTCSVLSDDQSTPVNVQNWYAVQTMSRHERIVTSQLERQGITVFFPTFTEVHRWSDRKKNVELPLFPGYLFTYTVMSPAVRRLVRFARGVAGLITVGGEPVPIPGEEIEKVQRLLAGRVRCVTHPFLTVGRRVRICGGALDGVEGVLSADNGHKGLVISIQGIQRSIAISIEGYDVEVL